MKITHCLQKENKQASQRPGQNISKHVSDNRFVSITYKEFNNSVKINNPIFFKQGKRFKHFAKDV